MGKNKSKASPTIRSQNQARLFDMKVRQAAVVEFERGNPGPIERLCLAVMKIAPQDPFIYMGLGNLEMRRGNFQTALKHFQYGIELSPENGPMHANLSSVYSDLGKLREAYTHGKLACELDPDNFVSWLNFANACNRLQKFAEAEAASRRALEINPRGQGAINNLGNALKELGRLHEAVDCYLQALEHDADFFQGYINLMLALLYHPDVEDEDISAAAKAFGHRLEIAHQPLWHGYPNRPEPWRKLRVGFLSPDLRSHAVMYYVEPLLSRLDRGQFEIVGYYLLAAEDAITERARRICDEFHNLAGMEPKAQAERIHSHQIDVLVDLAGHTGHTGLLAMSHRPAPVQMTWLGYPGTTGMSAIEWRLTDTVVDPEGNDRFYSEKLIRLPPLNGVYRPCIRSPLNRYLPAYQVKETPAMRNGFITFGCCNNVGKLTPRTLQLWARLLARLSTARLMIEAKGLHDPRVEEELRNKLESFGIPRDRLILVAQESRNQYLTYHYIDIVLDPFPLNGGTSSLDNLWMGVPLVSIKGDTCRSRIGMTILTSLGHLEWLAEDEEQYLAIAEKLASDISTLNALRLGLRAEAENSPLMNEPRFAALFGEAVRQAWLHWCARQINAGDAAACNEQVAAWLAERPEPIPVEDRVYLEAGESLLLKDAIMRLHDASLTPDEKRKLATRILESVPQVPEALVVLAELERNAGQHEIACQYLSHALDFLTEPLPQALRLVEWLLQDGQREQAKGVLHWLVATQPAIAGELQQTLNALG